MATTSDTNTSFLGNLGDLFSGFGNTFNNLFGVGTTNQAETGPGASSPQAAAANQQAITAAQAAQGAATPNTTVDFTTQAETWFNSVVSAGEAWVGGIIQQIAFVVVGLLLLGIGLWMLKGQE